MNKTTLLASMSTCKLETCTQRAECSDMMPAPVDVDVVSCNSINYRDVYVEFACVNCRFI